MGQRVLRSERHECEGSSYGLLETPGVSQSADEAVMCFVISRVGGDGGAKGPGRLSSGAGGKQIKPALGEGFGNWSAGLGHLSLLGSQRQSLGYRLRRESDMGATDTRKAVMKSHTEYLVFETKKRREMVHITDQVEEIVKRSGVKDGLCFVSPMHITAAIYVNDLENGLIEDIGKWLEELAPARPDYKHHLTGEDNADAHLKSLLLHHETTLPVTAGRLDLGTWQRVFYAEFDGRRRKRVIVKVLGVE